MRCSFFETLQARDHSLLDRRLAHSLLSLAVPRIFYQSDYESCFATVSTSLSPLPDRLTIIRSLDRSFFASFVANPIACADSSAGMIPSVSERIRKASRASPLLIVWYFTRPV